MTENHGELVEVSLRFSKCVGKNDWECAKECYEFIVSYKL
jgi:hypothetical protein